MKTAVAPTTAEPLPAHRVAPSLSLAADISELTKARLTAMVLLTTLAGYALASRGSFAWPVVIHTLIGTTLVAICSSILNQALERDTDALMHRTELRPFVTRRLPFTETILGGLVLGVIGLAELAIFVNMLTTLVALATLVIYVIVYTPLKRRTELNTFVGTIPGALPPLIGATAVTGHFNVEGWTLFAIMVCWQLPHFYAISWMYREDYHAAGLRMVSVDDASGKRTATHAVVTAIIMLPVSLLPSIIGHSGLFYGVIAAVLSIAFIIAAIRFANHPDRPHARTLFLTSIIYLPLLLIALAIDIPIKNYFGW